MPEGRFRARAAALLTICLCAGVAITAPVAAQEAPVEAASLDGRSLERRDADPIIDTRSGHGHDGEPVAGPSLRDKVFSARRTGAGGAWAAPSGRRVPGAITTTYEVSTPARVREVVDAAVATWDGALAVAPGAPVEVSVLWTDLGSRLLGQAGTEGEYRDPDQFPTDRWYPAALANQIANFDVNGAATPEVMVELNSGLGDDWYVGVVGRPAFGQVDLFSVVLHEVGHGLGFLGSAVADRAGRVRVDHQPPSIYDDFVLAADGWPITSLAESDAIAALTSDALAFDIGAGRTMPLSAPSPFVNGSSYSHFDESVSPDAPGALMTPALRNGEVQRDLDAAVLGVLDQLGWELSTPVLTPTLDQVSVSSGRVRAAWSEDWSQPVALPDAYVVRAEATVSSDILPPPRWTTITAGEAFEAELGYLQNGTTYRLSVTGQRGDQSPGPAAHTTFLLPANPNPVRDLRVGAALPVEVRWSRPSDSGEPIDRYEVQYRDASARTWSPVTTTAGNSARFELPEGRYWFRARAVNPIGPGIWTETALTGVSGSGIRPMPLDGQLARLYLSYFDRPPDSGGMRYWRDARAAGAGLATVSEAFARSVEFQQRYGSLSDAAFVDRVYRNVLGRPADPAGAAYWLGRLEAGAARGGVMLGFSESREYIRQTGTVSPQSSVDGAIERLHLAAFRRSPTPAELDRWRQRSHSASLVAIGELMLADREFTAAHGDLTDGEFVDVMYEQVVGRPPDDAGRRYWLDRLDRGARRSAVLNGFAQSSEFIAVTGTGV